MALADSDSAFALRLETDGSTVAVAVQRMDLPNARRQKSVGDTVSGLDLVVANCRVWGHYSSAAGNTVWAVVGPENRF
jgi:hypothetical protein